MSGGSEAMKMFQVSIGVLLLLPLLLVLLFFFFSFFFAPRSCPPPNGRPPFNQEPFGPKEGGRGGSRWTPISALVPSAWVVCAGVSGSRWRSASLCGKHPVSVSVSFSVWHFPVDRSSLVPWPLLASPGPPLRPSIPLRLALQLLLLVAVQRRHYVGVGSLPRTATS